MAISISTSESVTCPVCGKVYPKRQTNFPVYHSPMYNGTGTLNICKECLGNLYNMYFKQCGDTKLAIRQVCRKLDIYYSDDIYNAAQTVSAGRSMMAAYMTKVNKAAYNRKTYDDTLSEEGALWPVTDTQTISSDNEREQEALENIPEEVVSFWGPGYTADMYEELEQRRTVWMSRYPNNGKDLDVGTEALIRQICNLEIDINRDRAAGKSIDKSVNALNNLLGSAQLKPEKKDDLDAAMANTPFGVWINKWENKRPIPDPKPEWKDAKGIIKMTSSFFLGHLAKMLGMKNVYSSLYEREMERLSVQFPEYAGEDDDTFIADVFSEEGGDADEQ